jgi:formylglycine-generating enzyme required for sulfatase activity
MKPFPAAAALLVIYSLCSAPCLAAEPPKGMVSVPAGSFRMGSAGKARDEDRHERPVHTVATGAFFIDTTEVTTAQYTAFLNAVGKTVAADGHALLGEERYAVIQKVAGKWHPKKGKERHAMVNVTWYGAAAYAAWTGKRLPTEAEWEKAARGTDGRKFPWGSAPDESRLRFGQEKVGAVGTLAKGASPYGCLDMAGNAWEWTSTCFRPYPYVGGDGREAADSADRRVARGGSWTGEPHIFTTTYRFRPFPDFAHRYLGFRCAKSAE